jgi:hypothetical protein
VEERRVISQSFQGYDYLFFFFPFCLDFFFVNCNRTPCPYVLFSFCFTRM